MENINEKFRGYIRNKRRESKLTQVDVSDEAEISVRYYQYLESGKRKPTLEVCAKIACVYGMSLTEFCNYVENY